MLDYLIKNGKIIDGTNKPAFSSNLGIKDGKIAAIKNDLNIDAKKVIDAKGKYVTPGFIDVHRHADSAVFRDSFGDLELHQGLTTIINGNCGLSIVPMPFERKKEIMNFLQPVLGEPDYDIPTYSMDAYMQYINRYDIPINIGMLIGDGTVRAAVKGYATGKLSKEEIEKVHKYLDESLRAGALGVSLGIVYAPEYNYSLDDFVEVLQPMKKYNVPLVTHIRGEGDNSYESLQEVIEIARRLNVPLHISHLKCMGSRNWGTGLQKSFDLIESARKEGMDVKCDVYPYTAGSTQLIQILPSEYLAGGTDEIVKKLKDKKMRDHLTEILKKPSKNFENIVSLAGWDNIIMSTLTLDKNKKYMGKTVNEIAAMQNKDPFECAYDMLVEERCKISMIDYVTCEKDIIKILQKDYSNIISDSIYTTAGVPHPRLYGMVQRVFEKYVKEKNALTVENAVYKLSGLPACEFGLSTKGVLKEGMDADICVFDLDDLHTDATYENPKSLGKGFYAVFVNGNLALWDDKMICTYGGNLIRR